MDFVVALWRGLGSETIYGDKKFLGIAGAGGWPSQAALKRICGAVNNHQRLRAREDGAKPSPPRDCKAEIFGACHCSELRIARFGPEWEGRAAALIAFSKM